MPGRRPVLTNKGFSLIELLIAMMIIMVSMLAAMSGTITSIRTNVDNEMRTVATKVMTQTAEALLAMAFNDPNLTAGLHTRIPNDPLQSQLGLPNTANVVRGASVDFPIRWTVSPLTPNASMQVDIEVSYTNRSIVYRKNLTIFKHATI